MLLKLLGKHVSYNEVKLCMGIIFCVQKIIKIRHEMGDFVPDCCVFGRLCRG